MISASTPQAPRAMAVASLPVSFSPSGFSKFTPCQTPGMRKSRKTISVKMVVYTTMSTGIDPPRNMREAAM